MTNTGFVSTQESQLAFKFSLALNLIPSFARKEDAFGEPRTWTSDGTTTTIYDEEGRAWVEKNKKSVAVAIYGLKRVA
jgi:hypothetical protein